MKDLNKKKDADLIKEINELKEQNNKMKFSSGGSVSKDSFQKRKSRKNIARMLTEINNRNK